MRDHVAVTGMAINTPIGDTLEGFLAALLAGRSAISQWQVFDVSGIYSKVGADLSSYAVRAKAAELERRLPAEIAHRLRRLIGRVPWSTGLSMLLAADAWLDCGLGASTVDLDRVAVVIAGHNINARYAFDNHAQFAEEPDFIDGMMALHSLDTDHAGCVSELLQARGAIYTIGAACASGNAALRAACDEVLHHGADAAIVVGAVLDFATVDLHAMALMGAISIASFNEHPERASRPYDTGREGFVPAHGGGALIVERADRARRRGARVWADILGVESGSDGNHLPQPSEEGQTRVMRHALDVAGLAPEQIDYVNAHATSTPVGDVTELRSIGRVFGGHAKRLKINATKSMLGHTCWAAPTVESVAAILQMNAGTLHPSINIDRLDPQVDVDICAAGPVAHPVRYMMKNSFGFGGINSVSIFAHPSAGVGRA